MKNTQHGFTIVELIIYTAILLGLLYIFTSIFSLVLDMQLESQTQSAIVQDSGYIFARLQYDVGRATAIITPSSLGQQTTSLTLRIDGADFTYSLSNGMLQVTDPIGNVALNSYGTTVSNLYFRKYGNTDGKHSVSVMYTLTSTTQRTHGYETQDFQSTIGLR